MALAYAIVSVSFADSTVGCVLRHRLQRYILHASMISIGRAGVRTVVCCAEGVPMGRKSRAVNLLEAWQ